MTNSRAQTQGNWEVLDSHKASGTEATYTYTPATALNIVTKYREIYIIIHGKATATLQIYLKLNALTE